MPTQKNAQEEGWLADFCSRHHNVAPVGTIKEVGMPRLYRNEDSQLLTREQYKEWSKSVVKELSGEDREVDPIIWFTEMGHGPLPSDVKKELEGEC